MVNTLVTGATGFIGNAVAKRLLERGDQVRLFVRDRSNLHNLGLDVNDVVDGDITDATAVKRACAGIDVVYAIAGTFREPNLPDKRYRQVHVDAVGYMLDAARQSNVKRVVHCSTCGIHGNITDGPADESYPLNPIGIYEQTKAEGEKLALRLGGEYGVEVAVIRPTPVYGPMDTRLLKLFKLANKRRTVLLGPGTAEYHLVYIDDLVDAFLLAGNKSEALGESFLIGGPARPTRAHEHTQCQEHSRGRFGNHNIVGKAEIKCLAIEQKIVDFQTRRYGIERVFVVRQSKNICMPVQQRRVDAVAQIQCGKNRISQRALVDRAAVRAIGKP